MDYQINASEQMMQEMAKDFADQEIRPISQAMDRGEYDYKVITKKMADAGFYGIIVPEEYGGAGLDYQCFAIACEELSKANAAIGKSVSLVALQETLLLEYGTEDQKNKYLPGLIDGSMHASFALTEPDSGSDAASIKTLGVPQGDNIVINGSKCFITGASIADFFLLFFKYLDEDGQKKMTLAYVDRNLPGLVVDKPEELMGMNSGGICGVSFNDVVIPKSNIIGEIGQGFKFAVNSLNVGRMGIASMCVGIAQEAIDQTVLYTTQRMQFGKRLSQFQNTQFKLAEFQTQTNAARLLVRQAADAFNNKQPGAHLVSMAKYYASDVANVVARGCVQMHGGYGYTKEYIVERLYRDAKVTEIHEGTSEVHKMIISKWMGVK